MAFYEVIVDGKNGKTFDTYEEAMQLVKYHEDMVYAYNRVGESYSVDIKVIEKTSNFENGKIVWRNTNESPEEKVQRLVHELAQKKGVSDIEFILHTQDTINKTWDDPNKAVLYSLLFPDGKPTVAEFLLKLGDAANSL